MRNILKEDLNIEDKGKGRLCLPYNIRRISNLTETTE